MTNQVQFQGQKSMASCFRWAQRIAYVVGTLRQAQCDKTRGSSSSRAREKINGKLFFTLVRDFHHIQQMKQKIEINKLVIITSTESLFRVVGLHL